MITARILASLVNGSLEGDSNAVFFGAKADSRICTDGDMFAALPGENTDGSRFIKDAWDNGATVVLTIDKPDLPKPEHGQALIRVAAPLESLQMAAGEWRREATDLKIIGITGSNGKTTTKNILAEILVHWLGDAVLFAQQSYNSEIGLPLVLLGLNSGHKVAVLEMGMNHVGEMALISRLARAEMAIITNIGTAHIGMLGSQENIAREKRAIFDTASIAIVNKDEEWKDYLLADFNGKTRLFGTWGKNGWEQYEDRGKMGFLIHRHGTEIDFKLPGRHNLLNAMAAVEAALELGVPEASIIKGLEAVKPAFGRSEVIDGRITVLRDCYNANPESLKAAVELFGNISCKGRRIVVLGELLELGDKTAFHLKQAGKAVMGLDVSAVYLYGETLRDLPNFFTESGFSGPVRHYSDIAELGDNLNEYVNDGDCVLLKGSRGSALERLKL